MLPWLRELNARRGHGGPIREDITHIEVVELQHRCSRALDRHARRLLWLNVKLIAADGKWSNVDSRVAIKLHTVIKTEGELAARTDPLWMATLARHGFTLDDNGQMAQLAGAVRPFLRRSVKIEANRARLAAEWRAEHNGLSPGIRVLTQIDRRAWAMSRPNKSAHLDEQNWEATVRDELEGVDSALTSEQTPVAQAAKSTEALDPDLLSDAAVIDVDSRSTRSEGRFSSFDLRAGAIRALSRRGVIALRDALTATIDEIVDRSIDRSTERIASTCASPGLGGHSGPREAVHGD